MSAEGTLTVDGDAAVRFTQQLVRIPSVFDPERQLNEQPAADAVAELMRSFGWEPILEEVEPGRPNVIAVVDGGLPGPRLMFEGHTDVVTEGDHGRWTVDPFGGEIIDGRLYGRGAADMKSGVAAMLHAVRAVELAGPFAGSIVVGALVDEESKMIGVKHFLAQGHGAGVAAAIVCEPEADEICCVAKGAIRLGVTVTGHMAHGAMPHHGKNPNRPLAAVIAALAEHEGELHETYGEHPLVGYAYVTPTVIEAGTRQQLNVIPGSAWMGVDVRTVPEIDHDELVARVRSDATTIAKQFGVDIDVDVLDERPTAVTDDDHPVAAAVAQAHEEIIGHPPVFGGVPGSTDGTILRSVGDIPNVVYGPGPKWIAHQPDEYVEVDDIVAKTRIYARAAQLFFELPMV